MTKSFQNVDQGQISDVVDFLKSNIAPGTLVFFEGDPGVGKTFLISTLLKTFEIQDVASPTFALHHKYQAQELTFHHYDLYRVESEDDLETVGVLELMNSDPNAVFLIEWASKFSNDVWPLTMKALKVEIQSTDSSSRNYVFKS